jgi:uncharacterized protein
MELTTILLGAALILGSALIAAGFAAALLTLLGSVLAILFFKTRQIVIPGVTLFILTLLEAPIRYVLWAVGVEEDIVGNMIVEVRNMLYKEQFRKTEYSERMIFLPQCLRDPKCPAPLGPEGIQCINCGRCGIGAVKETAEAMGYRFFIAPGSSLIKRMVKKYRPKAVLGVGCSMEVKEGTAKMASYGLPVQGILLERDGCVDTRVDVVKLLGKIISNSEGLGRHTIESDPDFLLEAANIADRWSKEPVEVEVLETKQTPPA